MREIINIMIPVLSGTLVIVGLLLTYFGRRKDYLHRQAIATSIQVQNSEKKILQQSLIYLAPGFFIMVVLLFYFSEWQRAIGFLAGGLAAALVPLLIIENLSVGILRLTQATTGTVQKHISRPSVAVSMLISGIIVLLSSGSIIFGTNFLFGLIPGIIIVALFIGLALRSGKATTIQSVTKSALAWLSLAAVATLITAMALKGTDFDLAFLPISLLLVFIVYHLSALLSGFFPPLKDASLSDSITDIVSALLLSAAFLPVSFWLLRNLGSMSYRRAFVLLVLGVGSGLILKFVPLLFRTYDSSNGSSLVDRGKAMTTMSGLIFTSASIYAANYLGGMLGVALTFSGAVALGLVSFFMEQRSTVASQVKLIQSDEADPVLDRAENGFLDALSNFTIVVAFLLLGQGVFGHFLSVSKDIIPPLALAGGLIGVSLPLIFLCQEIGSGLPAVKKSAFTVFGLVFLVIIFQFVFGVQFLGGVILGLILSVLPLSGFYKSVGSVLALSALIAILISSAQATAISGLSLAIEWRLGILGLIIILVAALSLFVWRPNVPKPQKSL